MVVCSHWKELIFLQCSELSHVRKASPYRTSPRLLQHFR
jgi:hypothetical protein